MKPIYLVREQSDQNLHRFYQMLILPTLFNDWTLVREWGRIGSPGTVRKDWFETKQQATEACQKILQKKLKKGYQAIGLNP